MSRRLFALPALLALLPLAAPAAPPLLDPPAGTRDAGMVWAPHAVYAPVVARAVRPGATPPGASEVDGVVTLAPGRGAALWVGRLDVVRLTLDRDTPLRLYRVVGDATSHAVIEDTPLPLDRRTWLLVGSPAEGAIHVVEAAAEVEVTIDHLAPRPGRVIWETARRDLLDWAADPERIPALPDVLGAGVFRRRVAVADALAARVAAPPGSPAEQALRHWRRAVAIDIWAAAAPFDGDPRALADPLTDDDPVELDLPADATGAYADYVALTPGARRPLTLGRGAVRIEARVLDPGRGAPIVRLTRGDHVLLRLAPPSVPASVDFDPDAPLPDLRPLTTLDGRAVGPRREAVWSVPAAPSDVTLTVDGGAALVRLTHARVRPLIDEVGANASVADALAAARAALARHDDSHSARARLLVEGTAHAAETCGAAVDDPALAAWAAVRCLSVEPDDGRFAALGPLLTTADTAAPELARQLRVDAAALAEDADRDPTGLLPEPLPDDPLGGQRPPVDPRGFGAARAEEGWRRDPTSSDARAAALRTWYRSRWRTVPPDATADGSPRAARRWLTVGLDPRPDEEDLGRLTPLDPGEALTARLPAPPDGSSRLGLIVERPPATAPQITIGDTRWQLVPGAAVEPLTVAMPGGDHRIALDAPPDTRLWVDAPTDAPGRARVERGWPVTTPTGPLTITFDPSLDRRRLKLAVRGVDIEQAELTIETDIGPRYTAALTFGGPDPDARVLDGGPIPTRRVELVIDLPPTTGGVTLRSPRGDALLVRPALRVPSGGAAPAAPVAPATEPAAPDRTPLAAVAAASRALDRDPLDVPARVRRAHRLLDLDLPLLARADVERLDALPATPDLDRLLARFDAARDPDVLPMTTTAPLPLDPALIPANADPAHRQYATAAHRARLAGEHWTAARAHLARWRETGAPAAARGALEDLKSALAAPTPPRGAASLAFGLLTRLDDTGAQTGVRGLRGPAAAASRWLALDTVEGSGGYEELALPARSPFQTMTAQAREAIFAPDDPDAGHLLRPGRGATLALRLDRPAAVTAEIRCAVEIERLGCPLTIRRGAAVDRITAPAGETTRHPLGRGDRITAEVVLERGGAPAATVRFVADRAIAGETRRLAGAHVILPRRSRRVFRALPARPVELTVAGPGALRVEAWAPRDSAATALTITLDGPAGPTQQTLPLARGAAFAPGEGERPLRVGETRRLVVLLPDAGPHRVRLRPTGGEALARAAIRVDHDGRPPRYAPRPRAVPAFDAIGGLPTALAPPDAAALDPIGTLGTLSVRLRALQTVLDDDAEDGDDDAGDSRPPLVGELSVAWRRFFAGPRAHLMAAPALRTGPDAESVAGGRGRLRLDGVGPGFGLELAGQGWTALGDDGWSARAHLTGWRSLRLAPDWLLTPSLRLWTGRFADAPALDATSATIDPVLTTGWRRDHPHGARLGASLRWQALREQHLRARLDTLSNADFASVDRLDATLSWQALWGIGPATTLASTLRYRPSLRFQDDDRQDSGVAHALAAGVELGWWMSAATRLVVTGEFRPYLGLDGDLSPRFVLGVGVDFTGGRRLIDFTPIEEPYPDLAGRMFWVTPEADR